MHEYIREPQLPRLHTALITRYNYSHVMQEEEKKSKLCMAVFGVYYRSLALSISTISLFCITEYRPQGDYYLRVLMFDISADLHKSQNVIP